MERYVGIDLGISTPHKAVVFEGPVRLCKPFTVEVSREGFDELLRKATLGSTAPVTFIMEPTGLAWLPVAAYMASAGHRVMLAKPQKVSDFRKFRSRHTKSDITDAEAAALLPTSDPGGLVHLRVPGPRQIALKRLIKKRDRLAREIAHQKQRIHALMVMVNPAIMEALPSDKFSEIAKEFFRRLADPERVVKGGLKGLRNFWSKHSRGKVEEGLVEQVFEACSRTAALYRELRAKGELPFDYEDVQQELHEEIDELDRLGSEVKRLEAEMLKRYELIDPQKVLQSIPGVGLVTACAIEAFVGDIERFKNGPCFVAYCGLIPRKRQSGLRDQSLSITKAGQPLLRKYLYLAADVARQWDAEFAAYYAKRYSKGVHHNRILIALARKMALRIHAVLVRRARGTQAPAYVRRGPDGQPIERKAARTLILQQYSRKVLDQADRDPATTVPEKGAEAIENANEWPPCSDATRETSKPPSRSFVSPTSLKSNSSPHQEWQSIADILNRIAKRSDGL